MYMNFDNEESYLGSRKARRARRKARHERRAARKEERHEAHIKRKERRRERHDERKEYRKERHDTHGHKERHNLRLKRREERRALRAHHNQLRKDIYHTRKANAEQRKKDRESTMSKHRLLRRKRLKNIARLQAGIITGGSSGLLTKGKTVKSERLKRKIRNILTGGTTGMIEGSEENKKKMRRLVLGVTTGGVGNTFDKKSKIGKVASIAYAPVTSSIGAIAKKHQENKLEEIQKKEDAKLAEQQQANTEEAALLENEIKEAKNNSFKRFIPLAIAGALAIPFLGGE